jgi:hypothetical protein
MDTPKATTQKTNREIAAAVFGEERAAYTNPIFFALLPLHVPHFFPILPLEGLAPAFVSAFFGTLLFCVMREKAAHTERIKRKLKK